jgi:hypothetical protein
MVEKCKSLESISGFIYGVYGSLISQKVSQELQWKSKPSADDSRQGMSQLFETLSVIGGL